MFDNVHIELHERKRPRWQWLCAAVLCGGFVFFVLARAPFPVALVDMSAIFRMVADPPAGRAAATRGGDVAIEPPRPLPPSPPMKIGDAPIPSFFSASVLVADASSTAVLLAAGEEGSIRPVASVTKLMSALVLLERDPDWTATTTVPVDDVEDTHMYAGDTYAMSDLWHAALVGSSNKAVLALVDALGWTREAFVARMNEKAAELRMASTTFADPTGLDPRNAAPPRDIVILLRAALQVDRISSALQIRGYDLYAGERKKAHHMWNTDWLLLGWIPHTFASVRGGKTGYLPSIGYNVAVEVADDVGRAVDVVVLGAPSNEARFTDARDAAEWVYENYEWP